MAELKITEGLDGEISALRSAGNSLGSDATALTSGGLDLETCRRIIQQQQEIARLLDQYKALIVKDANDLHGVAVTVRTADQTIAANT